MAGYNFITNTGTITADVSDIRAEVVAEWQAVFGTTLDTDSSTVAGVLIDFEVLSRAGILDNNVLLANQINPSLAGGVYLDAIAQLLGIQRLAATKSTFASPPTLAGVANTNIPAGSIAQTTAGDQFELITTVQLDGSGNGTGEFQSVEDGAIPAPIGSLTQIVSAVIGWESITNTVAATLGTLEESDVALRQRRRRTLAIQGVSMIESIYSAVNAVDAVDSVSIRENVTSGILVIDGITMDAHSIYVAVSGGTDDEVADALLANKSLGAGWNSQENPVIVNVIEPISGQTYVVEFDRQVDVPMLVEISIKSGSETDAGDKTKEAILAYVNGDLNNEDGWRIGVDASPWELAGAVNEVYPLITVTDVLITTVAAASPSRLTVPMEIWEQATLTNSDITVTVLS